MFMWKKMAANSEQDGKERPPYYTKFVQWSRCIVGSEQWMREHFLVNVGIAPTPIILAKCTLNY